MTPKIVPKFHPNEGSNEDSTTEGEALEFIKMFKVTNSILSVCHENNRSYPRDFRVFGQCIKVLFVRRAKVHATYWLAPRLTRN